MHPPAEVPDGSLMHRTRSRREIRRHVMFKSVLANVMQQLLQLRNLHHAHPAKSIQRIASERTLADVPANHSRRVIGRESGEAHRTRFYPADNRAKSVLLAHRPGNDFLEVHAEILEEVLGKIAAMKADSLVGIVAVVGMPVGEGPR